MRDLWLLLDILEKSKVPFCFQCQNTNKHQFYNLSVNDTKNVNRRFSGPGLDEIEDFLIRIWGHKLVKSTVVYSPPPPHPMLNMTSIPRPF